MKIARVFPRKTTQTPTDSMVFFDVPPMLALPEIDEVHVSCVFTYDKREAEYLANQWSKVGVPVKIGGPAYGDTTDETFTPGRYVKHGITFTSVGCPNKCWFCSVWKRIDGLKELPIKDGWIVQDDNILATSKEHFVKVMEMLKRQPQRPHFSGGLEAKLLTEWHLKQIKNVNPKTMYFAYDTYDDYEPLVEAGKLLRKYEITPKTRMPCCYVLIGYPKDTIVNAEKRLIQTLDAGFIPFAMLYKNEKGEEDTTWRRFSRQWTRLPIIYSNNKQYFGG